MPTMTPEELRARTMEFAVRAVKFCRSLPDTSEARRIGGQLIDSSTSVAINYRAAGRGRSHREFTAKIGIVTEEADETLGWLELIVRLDLARGPEAEWLTIVDQLTIPDQLTIADHPISDRPIHITEALP